MIWFDLTQTEREPPTGTFIRMHRASAARPDPRGLRDTRTPFCCLYGQFGITPEYYSLTYSWTLRQCATASFCRLLSLLGVSVLAAVLPLQVFGRTYGFPSASLPSFAPCGVLAFHRLDKPCAPCQVVSVLSRRASLIQPCRFGRGLLGCGRFALPPLRFAPCGLLPLSGCPSRAFIPLTPQ